MAKVTLKEINRLAIPAIFAGIAEPVISLVDTAIIGNMDSNSEDALAAVGIASSFFLLVVWVLAQTKSAVSAIVSKHYGQQTLDKVKTLVPQAIIIIVLIGLGFTAITQLFSTEIFQSYNAKGLQLKLANEYFAIRSYGFPLTLATFVIFGVFRGMQNTLWAMFISLAGGAVNLFLDIILVYGLPNFIEPMGVEGAALASLIAQGVMFAMAVYFLLRKTTFSLRLQFPINSELLNMSTMTANLFARTLALNVAYFLANSFTTDYGTKYIAAHSIAMQIWLFSAFFLDGYANAGNAISGKLLGEQNFKALQQLAKDITRISVIIALILSGIYLLSYPIIGHFFTNKQSVLDVFNSIFWMVIIMQPINAIAFAFDGIFKGLGEAAYLRNVLILSTFIVFVPVIFLCDIAGWSIYSVWMAFIVWMIARGASLVVRFRVKYSGN